MTIMGRGHRFTEIDYQREYYGRMAAEAALGYRDRPATRNQIESLRQLADRIGIRVYIGECLTAEQASRELATLTLVLHWIESQHRECSGQ